MISRSRTAAPRFAARPRPRPRPRRRRIAALVVATSALAATGGAANAAASSGPTVTAWGPINTLVQSTGNLYWTTSAINEFGPSGAGVYRASKYNTPGAERLLYGENRDDYFTFDAITYANVGTWYGYFAANYHTLGYTLIKRVPLAGGPAVTLARTPSMIGLRGMDNDGSYLYWADATGLRRMPIGGGAITTLATGTNFSSVGLDATRVFYSAGSVIRSIPKAGGAATTQVAASSAIDAVYVYRGPAGTVLYWAEANGAVRSYALGGGVSTYQGPLSGRTATSVSFDGSRVLWTDCVAAGGNQCAVREHQGWTTTTVATGGVGARNVQGDASAMFWSDNDLERYVH